MSGTRQVKEPRQPGIAIWYQTYNLIPVEKTFFRQFQTVFVCHCVLAPE